MPLMHSLQSLLQRWGQIRTLRRYFVRQPLTPRACSLCSAEDVRLLIRGDRDFIGIRTSQCERCGFIFSSPYYSQQVIADFYRGNYRALYKGQPDPRVLAVRQGYLRERSAFYRRWLGEQSVLPGLGGSVLDVGCGEGTLLRTLRTERPDLELAGVEPTILYADHVSSEGGITVVGEIADLPPSRRFDLIVLIHVLEHVYDPVDLLERVKDRLADRGVLYVDVPDVSVHASITDLHLAHCNHFSAHTLRAALEGAGLNVGRLLPHRPPTLPPSIFAVAGRTDSDAAARPIGPDPERRTIARQVAAIDVSRVSFWRRRAGELIASRFASSRRNGTRDQGASS